MSAATASASASASSGSRYLPFNPDDPVWADIQPTYQHESANPLCPIMYKPEYSAAMDLYRSLVSGSTVTPAGPRTHPFELSARALALTEHLVRLNPSHYSIWQYRAKILIEGSPYDGDDDGDEDGSDDDKRKRILRRELEFLDLLAHENMKSYQVWQHRRLIVSALGDPSLELAFIADNLARDSKNYHTWAYRQWVLAHFGGLGSASASAATSPGAAGPGAGAFPQLWDGELDYAEKLLVEDVRNNSAWNHRWFCIFGRRGARPHDADAAAQWESELIKLVKAEIGFTKAQIALAPNNASAWNYLRGDSLSFAKSLISTPFEAQRDPTVDQFGRSPPQAIEWCLDCIEERLQAGRAAGGAAVDAGERERAVDEAEKLVTRLCTADPMRKRYWGYRLQSIRRTAKGA
ncbi:related to Protein farnesyltransferase alpha subunit [Pseudozyma flocculosa]|uniref:Protein farnesyltransferase/geranylgeranyltransferase type-1 subunit alpha n=1 Tax=Pseudozyma flocculosa TaxID=84751 RepID=A0A5C3F0C3_9BASI|nr:related to Protein farnesyltransferase alpha subunit [Pseudozyma flocculosa]